VEAGSSFAPCGSQSFFREGCRWTQRSNAYSLEVAPEPKRTETDRMKNERFSKISFPFTLKAKWARDEVIPPTLSYCIVDYNL
jgi:hypothetical protein